jgi:4-amino-4-deoxy-L-arabinose transferase-like glycosyltransferase
VSPSLKLISGYLGLILLLRLSTLGTIAITDPSEGRYATIAQEMVLSGDWVTPVTYVEGVREPFLGKPPLGFWASALALKIFGMNEFALRLPSYLAGILALIAIVVTATVWFSLEVGILSALVLSSMFLFYFLTGACTLDPMLMGVMAGLLASAASAMRETPSRAASYAVFFFAALGMLVKGPVALALAGGAILPWVILTRKWRALLHLPWIGGSALFFFVTTPWFLYAEQRSPGFLKYFFIHENFLRFLVKDYGDRYGSGHDHPYGMIWLMFLWATLPWLLFLLAEPRRSWRACAGNHWVLFALLWGIAPALFFSIAHQVSVSYVLPGLPGIAIFIAYAINRALETDLEYVRSIFKWYQRIGVVLAMGLLATGVVDGVGTVALFLGVVLFLLVLVLCIRSGDALQQVGSSALITAALFTAATIMAAHRTSGEASTKFAFEVMRAQPAVAQQRISFFRRSPQSALFYARSELPYYEMRTISELSQLEVQDRFLVLKEKDRDDVGLIPSQYTMIDKGRGKGWTVFERMANTESSH